MSKAEIKKFKCNSEDGCTELLHNIGISITFSKISHLRRMYSLF